MEPINGMQYLSIRRFSIGLIIILFLSLLIGCSKEKKDYINIPFDRDSLPSMTTDSVTELISDSGIIRYKVVADKWLIFDNATEPYWYFPEGLHLIQFDTAFMEQVSVLADTVWNFTQKKLWRLKGNVLVRNAQDETFKSDELFWDEKTGNFYSDKYIEIERPEKLMLRGVGFESNQQMTAYRIFRPHDTDIYIEEEQQTGDSVAVRTTSHIMPNTQQQIYMMPDSVRR